MTERLIIQNFAGLNIDIELGRINIFIGPQASGKSVCAKCLYWFKSFLPELISSAEAAQDKRTFITSFLDRFRSYFPNLWRSDGYFKLRYEIGDYFIELTPDQSPSFVFLQLNYSSFFDESALQIRNTIREMRAAYEQIKEGRGNSYLIQVLQERAATAEIREKVWKQTGELSRAEQEFVIAGRAFLSTLKGATLSFLATNPVIDPLVRDFLRLYERIRHDIPSADQSYQNGLLTLADSIARGRLLVEADEDFILSENYQRIPLINASSGQQEVFSLLLILLNLSHYESYENQGVAIYIEEPETHLFSDSQRILSRLLVQVYNDSYFPIQYFITTHSPYLLASFNNLIYAHQLAITVNKEPKKLAELYEIIPKNQQLPLADFRVYGLENGQARSLIDSETGLLSADLLDKASDVISEQFSELMDLDPSTKP